MLLPWQLSLHQSCPLYATSGFRARRRRRRPTKDCDGAPRLREDAPSIDVALGQGVLNARDEHARTSRDHGRVEGQTDGIPGAIDRLFRGHGHDVSRKDDDMKGD